MSGDRSVMPSAARIARARRAGLRPRSAWMGTALSLGAVALVISSLPSPGVRSWGQAWKTAVASSDGTGVGLGVALVPVLEALAWLAVVLVLAVAAARVLAVVVTGGAGPSDARELGRLHATASRGGAGTTILVTATALLAIAVGVRGVLAGGARGVAASPSSMVELWVVWPTRAATLVVVVLGAAAVAELWVSSRRIAVSLRRSPQQVREDRARRGSGR